MGCLINYLITLSTVFKLPQTPRKPVCKSIRSFNCDFSSSSPHLCINALRSLSLSVCLFGAQLCSSAEASLCACERQDRRCYLNFHRHRGAKGETKKQKRDSLITIIHTRSMLKNHNNKRTHTVELSTNRGYLCLNKKIEIKNKIMCFSFSCKVVDAEVARTAKRFAYVHHIS